MLRQQLYRDLQKMIAEVKKLDLPKSVQNSLINALKKMDILCIFLKHKQNDSSGMDFLIFDYLKEKCHGAFAGIDEEEVTYYLHEIVYNAMPVLREL